MTQTEALIEYFGTDKLTPSLVERIMAHSKDKRPLKPLKKPCHDCAVIDGFYEPYAVALLSLSPARRKYHCDRWHCHNNPSRSCAGAILTALIEGET